MDIVTQALLGAASAQAVAGRRLGRRATYWGALGGVLPDLDILARALWGPWSGMLHHRGVTHSLWFGPVIGPILGYGVWRYCRRSAPDSDVGHPGAAPQLRAWMLLFLVSLWTHPMLDVFTAYGTQLLAPFSRQRFAFNGVGIVDPFYSLVLLVGVVFGRRSPGRAWPPRAALALTSLYLLYGVYLNRQAVELGRRDLAQQQLPAGDLVAYPTLFQPFLRRLVSKQGDRFSVGWLSMWHPTRVRWHRYRQDSHPLIERTRRSEEGKLFEWFCGNRSAARLQSSKTGFTVELADTRYGSLVMPKRSLWGIRASYDAEGRLRGPIERYRTPMPAGLARWWNSLWRAAFPAKERRSQQQP